jgi:hypothetical protein
MLELIHENWSRRTIKDLIVRNVATLLQELQRSEYKFDDTVA